MKQKIALLLVLALLLSCTACQQTPTDNGTQAPTVAPTQAPTQSPTQAPTQEPTIEPTQAPTAAPTQAPVNPTAEPTQAPTQAPIVTPTVEPTQAPTQAPTVSGVPAGYTEVDTAQELHDVLEAGGKAYLTADISFKNSQYDIRIEKQPTTAYLDLNGHTITITVDGAGHVFNLVTSALVIQDTSAGGKGTVKGQYNGVPSGKKVALIRVNGGDAIGNLTVLGGNFLYERAPGYTGSVNASCHLIHCNGYALLKGGSFKCTNGNPLLYTYGDSDLHIEGGKYAGSFQLDAAIHYLAGYGFGDADGDGWSELFPKERIVAYPLTWDRINAIPVANSNMTEEQLRQICVDFMRLQLSFAWTPRTNFNYTTGGSSKTLNVDQVYGGLPYISSTGGSLYNAMTLIDANGVMDMSQSELNKIIGNQCSGSAFWAWSRISNSIQWGGTQGMLKANGCTPIGPYTYDYNITSWHNYDKPSSGYRTMDICEQNGRQTMYESYALLKMADGLNIYRTTAGHVRMVSSNPVVVRNSDGSINGDKSYLTYLDQVSNWKSGKQANGISIQTQGGVDVKISFTQLYNEGYLPWSIPELTKGNAQYMQIEAATASLSKSGSGITASSLNSAKVNSNYAITYVTVTVKDTYGNVMFTRNAYTKGIRITSYSMSDAGVYSTLASLSGKGYTVEVAARVSTGQLLTAYSGILN